MIRFVSLSAMTAIAMGVCSPGSFAGVNVTSGVISKLHLAQELSTPFTIRFSDQAGPLVLFITQGEEMVRLRFVPQEEGEQMTVVCERSESSTWKEVGRGVYRFWPRKADKLALQVLGDQPPGSWKERTLSGAVVQEGEEVRIRFLGRGLYRAKLGTVEALELKPKAGAGGNIAIGATASAASRLFEPVDLTHLVGKNAALAEYGSGEIEGVPFQFMDGGKKHLSLKEAGWSEEKVDPSSFYENYDLGPAYEGDPRLPQVQVPRYDYTGAWVLARVTGGPESTDALTLRLGSRGDGTPLLRQFMLADFSTRIPKGKGTQREGLHLVYVPFAFALAQDINSEWLDLEMTKEIRLARRSPDPCRYRWRPVGLPSGVEIAGITLVKSPLQLQIAPAASGALFVSPGAPAYSVKIHSLSGTAQGFKLTYRVRGGKKEGHIDGEIAAQGIWEGTLTLPELEVGHYTVEFELSSGGKSLLKRESMMAFLPPDEMKFREEGLLGTWDFGGNHFTSADPDFVGSVMWKLGLRYGMFRTTAETRAKYGVIKGDEAKVDMHTREPAKAAQMYAAKKVEHPDLLPTLLLFHEDGISAEHSNRPPDLFSGKPPYAMSSREKDRFEKMMETATQAAKSMREGHPEVKLALGNGGIALREELYRAGYPGELFDSAGNESMSGANPPESQPPNSVAINSGLWMDRQLLDAYGYPEKPVTMCFEVIYPSTTPGNLSYETQANYLIRHLLHAMAWKPGIIRPGGITDKGNSYYHSNWGASGLLTARPRFEPKPSAVALATLSRVLDGATYERFLETGSDSAYLLQFRKKDGSAVYPCWGVRGERVMTLGIEGTASVSVTDWQGRREVLPVANGQVRVTLSRSPRWLELSPGATIREIALGTTEFASPEGKLTVLDTLSDLSKWQVETASDSLLESYNPLTPRRKGTLSIGKDAVIGAIRAVIAPEQERPATVPMYAGLRHSEGIRLPEGAVDLGLQVRGNSAWGRIIYELKDASGQIWTSIGARAQGGSDWLADAIGREGSDNYRPGEIADWNTDDVYGLSRINFDGWGWVCIPLPGHYPGGYPWPANSQWRASGDGVVQLPLTLHRIIFEQSEKVLYVTDYREPRQKEIHIKQLTAIEREFDGMKSNPLNYDPSYQINIP